MSALAERLTPRSVLCKYGEMVAQYADAEDRKALSYPDVANIDIANAVTELWGPVSADVVGRHRRGVCCCPKEAA